MPLDYSNGIDFPQPTSGEFEVFIVCRYYDHSRETRFTETSVDKRKVVKPFARLQRPCALIQRIFRKLYENVPCMYRDQ